MCTSVICAFFFFFFFVPTRRDGARPCLTRKHDRKTNRPSNCARKPNDRNKCLGKYKWLVINIHYAHISPGLMSRNFFIFFIFPNRSMTRYHRPSCVFQFPSREKMYTRRTKTTQNNACAHGKCIKIN